MTAAIYAKAMKYPDDYVIEMTYLDSGGTFTRRTISPIRFDGPRSMTALCLCREEPRSFDLKFCFDPVLVDANDVLMPVEIEKVGSIFDGK